MYCCGLWCIILLLVYVFSNVHACNSTRQYVAAVPWYVSCTTFPHVYIYITDQEGSALYDAYVAVDILDYIAQQSFHIVSSRPQLPN